MRLARVDDDVRLKSASQLDALALPQQRFHLLSGKVLRATCGWVDAIARR
ncbi:hypothetical protein [Hyalangium rubrum]|uniref:Uncharacterized protein n=1 Tax=Hyalangium rubrum TaxID=3103134 RepID=A0ABU5H2G2_9BACT|nr:hypothetical protein [Hyalangium sp. s54d21]MDY7227476.1 hypothetical protein [Hyalangium sp. s54d21]